MADENLTSTGKLTELTADIVSAYVGNNPVPIPDLPGVIASVFRSLSSINKPEAPVSEPPKPKISIRKTITRDYIVSLEDGKQYRTLKRHLTTLGLTPEQYREKWSLPSDYPMVAESYSEQRSALAKSLGLGRKPGQKRGRQKKS